MSFPPSAGTRSAPTIRSWIAAKHIHIEPEWQSSNGFRHTERWRSDPPPFRRTSGYHLLSTCLLLWAGRKIHKKLKAETHWNQLFFSCTPTALRRNHDHFHGATSHMVSMPRLLLAITCGFCTIKRDLKGGARLPDLLARSLLKPNMSL